MSRCRSGWLRYHPDDRELDEFELFDRLARVIDRHFASPGYDLGKMVADSYFAPRKEEELDDLLATIARYLRQPWEWLEEQPMDKIYRMFEAAVRLIKLENGKRDVLDPASASEENR